jgi:hypothetical protein
MDFELDGTMHLVWDFQGPLDIENMWGKFSLDRPECSYKEIEISQTNWRIKYHSGGQIQTLDSVNVQLRSGINNLQYRKENDTYSIFINGQKCQKFEFAADSGIIGIMLDPHSYLFASRFEVKGRQTKDKIVYGCKEALLNSGNLNSEWEFMNETWFRYGHGAISKQNSGFAKWNFEGTCVEIFLPKGPVFDSVIVYIDGLKVGKINLKNDQFLKSSVVFKSKPLRNGPHAVYVESEDGRLPLDCIEVTN